jgi:geranylgeranyl reductase family protein
VIVVGGGPAGCAAAIFLRQRGREVLLLDEAGFPRDKVCGEGISPEAWRLLRLLGLDSSVRALHPYPLRGMTLVAPDGTSFRGDYRDRYGFAVRRRDFDHVLLRGARAAGVEVREETRATDLLSASGLLQGVVAEHAGLRETLTARLVIGADGRRSVVARRLGLLSVHPHFRKFAVRGYWEGVEALDERGEMHVAAGGYCGIAPLSPTRANVTFVVDQRAMREAGGGLEDFFRSSLCRRWPRVAERLAHATLLEKPRTIGPLALVARGVSGPGTLLVGDAAGFYDPFTGEGVTLALHSAEIAAEVGERFLAAGPASDLGAYDPLRHAATAAKFRFNRLLQTLVGHPRLANLAVHRLAARPDLSNRLVAVAGDFVPARTVLGPGFLWKLLFG